MTRGFEDLVREESLLPAAQGPLSPAQELQRVDSLEHRVRVTMDRLTELVEAQLPEAVDGLRADFEQLRTELRQALEDASAALAEERFQLRSQIATTVGAANRWFVRTRDQLFERLDEVARVASAAQAEAEVAASAAVAAAVPITAEPSEPVEPSEPTEFDEEPVADQSVELEWGAEDLTEGPEPVPLEEYGDVGVAHEAELEAGYDYELKPPPAEAAETVVVNLDAPELDVLLAPLRDDLREIQGEISAMGAAVMALRDDVEMLGSRIPARAGSARLTPGQIRTIVDAVQSALPAPAARRSAAKASAAKATKRTTGAKRATKKVAAAGKRVASTRAAAPVTRRRTPPR